MSGSERERRAAMENVIKLVIAVTLLHSSSSEAPREYLRERSEPTRNKSLSNHYLSRNHNEDKFLNERPYLTGSYREIRPGVTKEKSNPSNRDFYRKNYEVKVDPERRPVAKWITKEVRKEDVLRKVNRDSQSIKSGSKTSRKEYSDSLNTESYSNREQQEEDKFASTNIFSSEDSGDSFANTRQRKIKKHGSSGYIPTTFQRERKPNIILILTDDQDVELGSLNFMPKTLRLLRDGGAEFRHAYVTTPMCCPSRSSLLTGMYVHNHNVFTNNENCSNIQWQQTHETRTFATYLSNAGYRTGYFGKYLNKYNGSYIPPGWREWGGLIMNSRYYNYSINMNGKRIKHGFDYYKDYYPDLIANDSIAFLRESKQYFSRKPVMLVVSFPAPHGPEDSAPQYSEMFFNVTTHHTPSYDYAPNPDKQWILRVTNKMQDIHKQFTDILMTKRLQTLQSVDSAVERIYQELKNINELENTYIIYTSDHGYHLGQFGLVKGKSFPFEFDVRVPFLVRGPGIEPGTVVDDIVLNIDLAPTFLDLGGVELPLHMDGRSILRLLHQRPNKRRRMKWPDTFLIESSGRREIPETAEMKRLKQAKIKAKETQLLKEKEVMLNSHKNNSRNFSERHFNSKTKSHLSREDPSLIDSSEIDSNDEIEEENSEETSSISDNQQLYYGGLSIPSNPEIQVDNKIPEIAQPLTQTISKVARLAMECQSPDLQAPCQPGQKWHCIAEGDKWRKYKCKFQGKCTCYTPDNYMYTLFYNDDRSWTSKVNYNGNNKQSKFMRNFRKKRSQQFNLWDKISETVDFSSLLSLMQRSSAVMSRKKRETTEGHISDILDDLEHELLEAEETESTMNVTFSLQDGSNLSKCSVTSQGKVNCSSLIYTDIKVWKKSRDEIESKIKRLKVELEALKEIRKHLREKRPEPLSTSTSPPISSTLSFISEEPTTEFSNESYSFSYSSTTESSNSKLPDNDINVLPTDGRYFDEVEASTRAYYPTSTEKNFTFEVTTPKVHKPKNHTNSKKNEDGSSNSINGNGVFSRGRDRCICRQNNQDLNAKKEEKELMKEAKRKIKEERLRKKERKLKKKAKLEKECLSEKMNCFIHDNEHWRTAPFWSEGPFCFCMNANNNTYSCLRTINSTHNFLYCEFTTGFRTFYNLRIDPFEQTNRMPSLTPDESRYLSNQLADMKACKGTKECTPGNEKDNLGFNTHHHHSYNVPPIRGYI